MSRQEIAQERARAALEQVREAAKADAAAQNAYVSYLAGLPATIISSGLGQTVAMLLARSAGAGEDARGGGNEEAYRLLAQHLEEWLCARWEQRPYRTHAPVERRPGLALMKEIAEGDQAA